MSSVSASYISSIGATSTIRYDTTMPVNLVPGTQPKVPLIITYPTESDPGPYPIPPNAQVEPGSDAHVIVVDKDNCILYETYNSHLNADGSWSVDSAAKWDLTSDALRPAGWTSADAAGLPIMPGVLKYDEVASGEINHALRFTAPHTQRLYVWPARHYASTNTSTALPPMGQRFRLKSSFNIAGFPAHIQTILKAMQQYGIILADNGLAWSLQAEPDSRWSTTELDTLRTIAGSNFEAVNEAGLMVDVNSGQALQTSGVTLTVSPTSTTLSASQTQQFRATVTGSTLGVVWSLDTPVGTISTGGLYTAPSSVTTTQTIHAIAKLTDGSKSASAAVALQTVPPAALQSVSASSSFVTGGSAVNVTVSLTEVAPSGGAAVQVSGSNPAFPTKTITVPAGAASATLAVTTSVVTVATPVTITASYGGKTATTLLTVDPVASSSAKVSSMVLYPTTITGGANETVYLYLTAPAPSGGVVVSVASSNSTVLSPFSTTIPAGSSSARVVVPVRAVTATQTLTLTASGNGGSASAVLKVNPPSTTTAKVNSMVLYPTTVTGGANETVYVYLTAPAPSGGIAVSVASSNSSVFAPFSTTIPAGGSSVRVVVSVKPVSTQQVVSLSASGNGGSDTATLTVVPPA